MKRATHIRARRGTAIVEMAIVLPVLLLILIGIVDLGVAVWSYNNAAAAAREGTRYAAVHGSFSAKPAGPAANDAALEQITRSYCFGMMSNAVGIQSAWPDGNNNPGSRVTVQVQYKFSPILLLKLGTLTFNNSSTTTITY